MRVCWGSLGDLDSTLQRAVSLHLGSRLKAPIAAPHRLNLTGGPDYGAMTRDVPGLRRMRDLALAEIDQT